MMGNSGDHRSDRPLVPKVAGNPEGKGDHAFLTDWCATEPRGVVAKPQRRVLAELFTSMLVLSASFKYRPVPGGSNYLYWIDGRWSLSLIAPYEWSDERRAGFAGTCVLQRDMTWTIVPSDRAIEGGPVAGAIRRFFEAFAAMLDTDLTLEECKCAEPVGDRCRDAWRSDCDKLPAMADAAPRYEICAAGLQPLRSVIGLLAWRLSRG
jgi:hypothetical protein